MAQPTIRQATKIPSLITASTWGTVYKTVRDIAARRNRKAKHPLVTNKEMIRLLIAWKSQGGERFPFAYQLAAGAWGWTGVETELDTSSERGAKIAPEYLREAFWESTKKLAADLDRDSVTAPRLDTAFDFGDPLFQSWVMKSLSEDGAASFTIRPPTAPVAVEAKQKRDGNNFAVLVMLAIALLWMGKPRRLTQG